MERQLADMDAAGVHKAVLKVPCAHAILPSLSVLFQFLEYSANQNDSYEKGEFPGNVPEI